MATVEHITTADQLFQAPNLGRCELLRGELIMMSPAGSQHGAIAAEMAAILRDFVKPRRLGAVLGAETGFLIGQNQVVTAIILFKKIIVVSKITD